MTDLPSYKLVQRLMHESGFSVADPNDEMAFPEAKFMKLASRLIQYGADQELEACCKWLAARDLRSQSVAPCLLRIARRPKPPSLKEQALTALSEADQGLNKSEWQQCSNTIRRALEQLDD